MSDSEEMYSVWSDSDTEAHTKAKASGKRARDIVLEAIEDVEARYSRMNSTIDTLTNQAKAALAPVVDEKNFPIHLDLPLRVNSLTPSEIVNSLGSASSKTAVKEWAKALPFVSDTTTLGASPPRVVQMPEWVAILQLMAVQIPKLNKVADELELIGHGYYYSEKDAVETEAVGDWLKANIGPLDVQVYKTRISSLKGKIGSRTKVKGGEAVEISPLLPVRFFNAHVVSVLKDDLEDIALKIIASDPRTSTSAVIEIGRGRNPYHIAGVGGIWSRVISAIAQLRSKTKHWVE